jgi:hypothetical protein
MLPSRQSGRSLIRSSSSSSIFVHPKMVGMSGGANIELVLE